MTEQGFSLIELLIAMTIGLVMLALVAGAYWAQTKTGREQQMVVDMQQNMRTAMHLLKRDIKMAGYGMDMDSTFSAATSNTLSFSFVADRDGIDNDSDGATDENGETETIRYRLYDSAVDADAVSDDLQRQPGGSAIAGNIENLEFFYTLADGTRTTAPGDFEDIRAVGISLLARTESPTRPPQNATYTPFSGNSWGPYNDGFERQIVKAVVQCRNMLDRF
jgi:type IV pilus assembly protein PilW